MLIQYITGPATGEMKHVENGIGQDAIDSGRAVLVTEVARRAPRTAVPPAITWEVVANPFIGLRFRLPDTVDHNGAKRENYSPTFFGDPNDVNTVKRWDGGERYIIFGRRVPDEAVERYKAAWKTHKDLRCNVNAHLSDNHNELMENDRQNVVARIKERDAFAATKKRVDG